MKDDYEEEKTKQYVPPYKKEEKEEKKEERENFPTLETLEQKVPCVASGAWGKKLDFTSLSINKEDIVETKKATDNEKTKQKSKLVNEDSKEWKLDE